MEFLKIISWYYHSEAKHGYIGAAIGVLLLIAASVFLKYASPFTLLKGLTIPLFIGGLIFGLGGGIDGQMTQKALPQKLSLYKQNQRAFFTGEVSKVEKTHQSWFGIRLFWTAITLTGIAMLFTLKKNFWIGVGLGTLFLGLLGHVEEAISMKRNEKYWKEVLKSAQRNASATPICSSNKIDVTKDEALLNIYAPQKGQPSANRLPIEFKSKSRLVIDTSNVLGRLAGQDQTLIDSSASKSAMAAPLLYEPSAHQGLPDVVTSHDTIADTPLDETKDFFKQRKNNKLVDYYRSDLIGKDGVSQKKCWFIKKYLH